MFRLARISWRQVLSRLLPLSTALVPALVGIALARNPAPRRAHSAAQEALQKLPTAPTGSGRCVFCHPAEVQGYARTTMAHSLRRAGQEPEGVVEAHGSRITMFSSPQGTWQRWESRGETSEYRIDYVIGSGIHAAGYLANVGGRLFQSPVAYYSSRHAYDLAPGYEEVPDPDFTRPVAEECVLCHSGTALHVPGSLNQYQPPIFSEEAITCERCHGPAEKHLADPRAGTIVNPAKLEPAARDSVCEQCHLIGVARVANPGRKIADFIPGQPLENTFTIYHDALPAGSPAGSFKVISHVEQLALSTCARGSEGRLWCGTCHDPHNKPVEPVQYYRAKCLSCHSTAFAAPHPATDSNCLACHMPRRNAQDGGHTVFTDHRIERRPQPQQDLPRDTAIAAWRDPSSDFQKRNLGIAFIAVGMERHSSAFIIQGYRDLVAVQQQFQDDSEFLKWIGDALLVGKQSADAKFAFERALQLDPDSPVAEASAASPYIQQGDLAPAIQHLSRAVALDPLYLPAVTTLMDLYGKQGDSAAASALAATIKKALDSAVAPQAAASDPTAGVAMKNTEDVFKNIQILKGVPSTSLLPTMQFISSSLGVPCSFCHVDGHFEKDDKKPKQTARKMMQMILTLNRNHFANQREITCYSCHRGAQDPVATPETEPANARVAEPAAKIAKLSADLPNLAQLLSKYVNALGGAPAIETITTRIAKGTETSEGRAAAVEVFTRLPAQQVSIRHLAPGDNSTFLSVESGWLFAEGHPPREILGDDLDFARADADLHFPLHFRQLYPDLRVEYEDVVNGSEVYVLSAIRDDRTVARFYFEKASGLLARAVRYSQSLLGENPTQITYGDYREVGGVKVPFHVVVAEPGKTTTIQLESVQQNIPIPDSRFVKPAPASESKSDLQF